MIRNTLPRQPDIHPPTKSPSHQPATVDCDSTDESEAVILVSLGYNCYWSGSGAVTEFNIFSTRLDLQYFWGVSLIS